MCGAHTEEIGKAQSLVEKGGRLPQACFISAMGAGFVLQYNGIGSTHLMSHIISYVVMGSPEFKR